MKIADLVQEGWSVHDSDSEALADRLEAHVHLISTAAEAAQWMQLASHTVGDHLQDRTRARRMCEMAAQQVGEQLEGGARLFLAVARALDGDTEAADQAAAPLGAGDVTQVRMGMLIAQGHMHAGNWAAALTGYETHLATAEGLPEGNDAERSVAIVSNNMASELLELDARDDDQDRVMGRAAEAAYTFWKRVGTWVNEERGEYLRSLVYNARGQAAEGLAAAERGLALIEANGEEAVDQAFLLLAKARGHRDLGQGDEHAASLAAAQALADDFPSDGLKSWFATEYAKAEAAS